MSEEKNYFICRNEECNTIENYSGENVSGGSIIEYKSTGKNKTFECKHCKSEYKIEKEEILHLWGEKEMLIESNHDYKNFLGQYGSKQIYFKKLSLKNIEESDFRGKNLSFTKCVIDELIIENINITSSFFPILFSECIIGKVKISNCNITRADRSTYKSLWNFFGVNFFKSDIKEAFIAEHCKTSMIVFDCNVKCSLEFSKSSEVDLALAHNKKDPRIIIDKTSDVNKLLDIPGRDPSASEEKVVTAGDTTQKISIEELHVDPDTKDPSNFENCLIQKLVFKAGSNIKGKLFFKNCIIEEIVEDPYCFEQDLIFLNCTFPNKLHFARSHFNQLLIFELCTFEASASFNEIKVEADLHLSYSVFKVGLVLSGNRCEGYLKCQINTVHGEVLFEDNTIARDVIFRTIHTDNDLIFSHNELNAYLILRQITSKGNIEINMLNADALSIDTVALDGFINLGTLALRNDLNIGSLEVQKSASITFANVDGIIRLERSDLGEYFNAYFLESGVNIISNNNIKGNCFFNSCTFNQQSYVSRNLCYNSFNLGTMNIHDIICNNNHFLGDFTLKTIEAKNITLDSNFAVNGFELNGLKVNDINVNENFTKHSIEILDTKANDISINYNSSKQDFEIKTTKANDLYFNDNKIKKTFTLSGSEFNNIKLFDNLIRENLSIDGTKTNDLYLVRNKVKQEIELIYLFAGDLIFKENYSDSFSLLKSTFNEVSITKCLEIGDTNIANLDVNANFKFNDNQILKTIFLSECTIHKALEVEYNIAEDLYLLSSSSGESNFNKNFLTGQLEISKSGTKGLNMVENHVKKLVQISNSKVSLLHFEENNFFHKLLLNIIEAKDIYIAKNIIQQGLEVKYPNSEDLFIDNNNVSQISLSNGNFIDLNIKGSRNINNLICYNVNTKKNIIVKENPFEGDIYIELCKAEGDIELNKNAFRCLDILNTEAHNIRLTENQSDQLLNMDNATARDIILNGNLVASDMKEEERIRPKSELIENRAKGVYIYQCSAISDLSLESNDSPAILQIMQTLADTMTLTLNKTQAIKIRSGKYRQVSINNCTKVGEFYCNNVSVSKDVSFKHNLFAGDFTIMYSKIENDLDFQGNIFTGLHRLFNNTVQGSLNYQSSSVEDNGENFDINTNFKMTVLIQHNKFNFVTLENAKVDTTLYFENNTVQGSLRFGKADLSEDSPDMILGRAIAMTDNKINNASFIRLQIESDLCMHYNNFEADLTFRDITHTKSLDFTGCFVGGSFVFHNRRSAGDNGDLILDNAFVDKRISFTNYKPSSFSFINATFNGFEIPGNWRMRAKKLVSKPDKNIHLNIWIRILDWFKRTFLGIDNFILKENLLKAGKLKDADLPYSLLKDHFDASDRISDIHAKWKVLKADLFTHKDKMDKLVETHRRKDQTSDKDILNSLYSLYNESIDYSFIPIYYHYYSEYGMEAIIVEADHFANIENNYKDPEAIAIIDNLKEFFISFRELLIAFRDHTIIQPDRIGYKEKQNMSNSITGRLAEQYRVLRQIWGNNGDLKEEDSAYFKWMHYKNTSELHSASIRNKARPLIRYLLYEKVFGWGVDLPRIVRNTFLMVVIFTAVYGTMFQTNPDLTVWWDNQEVKGASIDFWDSAVFALQTTFSAGLGDWAPIGSGSIKVPMTINAILGVLFVTFLIGAYGRKMLR